MTGDTAPGARFSASRRSAVDPFLVMDVITRAARREAAGEDIIHMEVGQPATPAPAAARAALKVALDTDVLGYTEALGLPRLRERIAQHYVDIYGVTIGADRIVVTTGSSAGFILAFLALFDAGARVAVPTPGYPCYRQIISLLGLDPVLIETGPAERWMPAVGQIQRAVERQGARGLLIASPANPTGVMLEPGRLAELVEGCTTRGAWFISDEIYHGLDYEFAAETALAHGDSGVVVINSFSKYFSMTGWRIGWMVVPPGIVRTVERIAQNLYISAPAAAQVAALGAFDGLAELNANKLVYRRNRDVLLDGLRAAGFDSIVPADGAFYLYVDVSRFTDDSVGLANRMLDEIGVAVTPGVDFDAVRGSGFLRFSYAGSTDAMREGVRRIGAWTGL